jgi:hypothetical protein
VAQPGPLSAGQTPSVIPGITIREPGSESQCTGYDPLRVVRGRCRARAGGRAPSPAGYRVVWGRRGPARGCFWHLCCWAIRLSTLSSVQHLRILAPLNRVRNQRRGLLRRPLGRGGRRSRTASRCGGRPGLGCFGPGSAPEPQAKVACRERAPTHRRGGSARSQPKPRLSGGVQLRAQGPQGGPSAHGTSGSLHPKRELPGPRRKPSTPHGQRGRGGRVGLKR